jgi:uncharacterized glyoxalase superfamily protein PhnB
MGCADTSAVDAFVSRTVPEGAELVMPAAQQPWGYVGSVADPNGHIWTARADAP